MDRRPGGLLLAIIAMIVDTMSVFAGGRPVCLVILDNDAALLLHFCTVELVF